MKLKLDADLAVFISANQFTCSDNLFSPYDLKMVPIKFQGFWFPISNNQQSEWKARRSH